MSAMVLDASAVLALLRSEPGGDDVAKHMDNAIISAVNLQEVAKEMLREGADASDVREILDELRLDIRAHDADAAYRAAELYAHTKQYGRGLGDRSCMALAISEKAPALTADREWAKIKIRGLKIKLVR
jgi:ribonuclease VapC